MDRNHIQACTARPPGEHPRQVSNQNFLGNSRSTIFLFFFCAEKQRQMKVVQLMLRHLFQAKKY